MIPRVHLDILRVGACRHLECMAARGGRWQSVEFPALCGLIQHPTHGWMLYDTGYAEHFFKATRHWPERLYGHTLPVDLPASEHLTAQLSRKGIAAADISLVIVSHYHGDHIAGLRDFPNARFIALKADTDHFMALTGHRWRATFGGHLPALLPPDYGQRLLLADHCPQRDLPSWLHPFTRGFDLLNDGSLLGVPLPGHSLGQLGLFIPSPQGQPAFLIADACWSLPALREGRLPSRLTTLITADRHTFTRTFKGLETIARSAACVHLLPSHCNHAWQEFQHAH